MSCVPVESVRASYLRFPLEITDRLVTVFTPDGRLITRVCSLPQARCVVRGYRKEQR